MNKFFNLKTLLFLLAECIIKTNLYIYQMKNYNFLKILRPQFLKNKEYQGGKLFVPKNQFISEITE